MKLSIDNMLNILKQNGRSLNSFKKDDIIFFSNKMNKGSYKLSENPGENFSSEFKPYFSPGEMLSLGIFEGKYLNDCILEYPAEWFINAILLNKLSPGKPNELINLFKIKSRQNLNIWYENGWLPSKKINKKHIVLSDPEQNPDERGWFQWYCRYWIGRRIPLIDDIQIKRWKTFIRHSGAIKANCSPRDLNCRPKQRQALLQWAHNSYI